MATMGEAWFESPLRGEWIRNRAGQLIFPNEIRVGDRMFRRAEWREEKPGGVVDQYREAVAKNSQHLYVYGNGAWVVTHTDDVNPDIGDGTAPVRHFLADHPLGKGLLLVGGAVLAGVAIVALAKALDA